MDGKAYFPDGLKSVCSAACFFMHDWILKQNLENQLREAVMIFKLVFNYLLEIDSFHEPETFVDTFD